MTFSQTGNVLKSWVRFTDRTTPTSQALFNGSSIYMFGAEQTFALDTLRGVKSIPMPDMPNYVNTSGLGISGSWNNMKGPVSFSGIQNPKMNITCNWTSDLVNNDDTKILMNPYIAIMLASSGRRLYLEDERIVNAIKTWDTNSSNTMYPNGMPIVIDNIQMRASGKDDRSLVTINFAVTEDKE